ncbi:hypothetical protein [Streptomyces sp. NPDC059649]|uniref:hypothetical protein n=1 Tax=Streptomyces sp. NPDC059649 TaxID=3346895 RepID=UPI00368BA67B
MIDEGSADGFRAAVRQASVRWGGITELIFPVAPDGQTPEDMDALTTQMGIDAVVNVNVAEDRAQRVAHAVRLPLVPLAHINNETVSQLTCPPASVMLRNEPTLIADEDAPLWQVAVAGDLSPEDLLRAQMQMTVGRPGVRGRVETRSDGKPSVIPRPPFRGDVEIAEAQLRGSTLLAQTKQQLVGRFRFQTRFLFGPAVIVVSDADDVSQCIAFWNARAVQPFLDQVPVMLLPRHGVDGWAGFGQQVARALARVGSIPTVWLNAPNLSDDELERMAEVLGLTATDARGAVGRLARPCPHPTYTTNLQPQWLVGEVPWGKRTSLDVHVYADRTVLDFEPPVRFLGSGSALLRLTSEAFDGLPRRPEVAQLILRTATWNRDRLQLQVNAVSRFRFELRIPQLREVLSALLDASTERWELSDKGRLATGVGAPTGINPLLELHVYEALVGLTTPRSDHLVKRFKELAGEVRDNEALRALAGDWGGRAERVFRMPQDIITGLGADSLVPALERACEEGWVERGLGIICSQCKVKSFVPLSDVAGVAQCPGCSAPSRYVRENGKAVALHYRLNSYIDRASDLGTLPHLLVVEYLIGEHPHSSFLPGVNLHFGGGKQLESDIYGIWGGKILAGEVKTQASDFNDTQLEKDVEISRRLGVDIHLIASVDTMPREIREKAERLCANHDLDLLILDERQLRPGQAEHREAIIQSRKERKARGGRPRSRNH